MITPILNVPMLYAGQPATLSWSVSGVPAEFSVSYQLSRRYDTQPGYEVIYSGVDTTYTDTMPEHSVESVSYLLVAFAQENTTWEEYDAQTIAKNITWAIEDVNIINQNITWVGETSLPVGSGEREITPNRPPIISGQDEHLGARYRGFEITWSVVDPDPNNTVDVVITLDSTVIFDQLNVQQGIDNTITITYDQINKMPDGSVHNITITATDNKGAQSKRVYTFTAVEDLISKAVFYVLRDGKPVAKITTPWEWQDYMSAGTHTYAIRAVDKYDNFVDSNPVTITTAVEYATLALADQPEDMTLLKLRRGEPPTISRSYGMIGNMSYTSGRKYPVYTDSRNRSDVWSLAFTHRTLSEYRQLLALSDVGQPVIYRDCYNNVIIGRIPALDQDFLRRTTDADSNVVINFSFTIEAIDYSEVVPYD